MTAPVCFNPSCSHRTSNRLPADDGELSESSSRPNELVSLIPPVAAQKNFLTFDDLIKSITPLPGPLPSWNYGHDYASKTFFMYKTDIERGNHGPLPKITSTIAIQGQESAEENGAPVLMPSIFMGAVRVHPACCTMILGHEGIRQPQDLITLQEQVDRSAGVNVYGEKATLFSAYVYKKSVKRKRSPVPPSPGASFESQAGGRPRTRSGQGNGC